MGMVEPMSDARLYPAKIVLWAPEALPQLLDALAARECKSRSQIIRETLIARARSEGFSIGAPVNPQGAS